MQVWYKICPHCLSPVPITDFDRDYLEGEVKSVKVDVKNCATLLGGKIYRNAKCSTIQELRRSAGKIALKMNLSEEEKNKLKSKVVELKRKYPNWKDYQILEIAVNSVLFGYNIEGG